MKFAFIVLSSILTFSTFASEGQLGASLKIRNSDISLSLSCLKRDAAQKCLAVQSETNFCPNDNVHTLVLNSKNLKQVEKSSIEIKQSLVKKRYLKAGINVSESVGHTMDNVFGEEKTMGEMAISIVPIFAGAAVDAVKSPAIISAYLIAKARATTAIQNELKLLLDESKRGEEIEVSREDLVSIFNGIRNAKN